MFLTDAENLLQLSGGVKGVEHLKALAQPARGHPHIVEVLDIRSLLEYRQPGKTWHLTQ